MLYTRFQDDNFAMYLCQLNLVLLWMVNFVQSSRDASNYLIVLMNLSHKTRGRGKLGKSKVNAARAHIETCTHARVGKRERMSSGALAAVGPERISMKG